MRECIHDFEWLEIQPSQYAWVCSKCRGVAADAVSPRNRPHRDWPKVARRASMAKQKTAARRALQSLKDMFK